jgi:hypothetical protein
LGFGFSQSDKSSAAVAFSGQHLTQACGDCVCRSACLPLQVRCCSSAASFERPSALHSKGQSGSDTSIPAISSAPFCATGVDTVLKKVCPNCGGGFAPRPIRPARDWKGGNILIKNPTTTQVKHQPVDPAVDALFCPQSKSFHPTSDRGEKERVNSS